MADEDTSYENVQPKIQPRTPPDGGNNSTNPELYMNMSPPLPQRKPVRPPTLPPKKTTPTSSTEVNVPLTDLDHAQSWCAKDQTSPTDKENKTHQEIYDVEDYTEPVETFPGRHIVLAISDMRSIIHCADSIGYIQIQSDTNTVVRVGSKYIMTNLSFVENILGKSTDSRKPSAELPVQVMFVPPGENPDAKRRSYSILAEPAFTSKDLNVAILTIKRKKAFPFDDIPKPLPISKQETDTPKFLQRTVHILGYDTNGYIMDHPCFSLHRNDSLVSKTKAIAGQLLPNQHDFSNIHSKKHALFYCNLPEEANGSPVLVTEEGSPRLKVCAMICRRYPVLCSSVRGRKMAEMPGSSVFHQGLKMKALYDCIRDTNPKLRDDLFSDETSK